MDVFRERLKEIVEQGGKAKSALSGFCGRNHNTLRRYIRGESEPTLKSLIYIAKHFDISIDYLAGLSDNPNIQK